LDRDRVKSRKAGNSIYFQVGEEGPLVDPQAKLSGREAPNLGKGSRGTSGRKKSGLDVKSKKRFRRIRDEPSKKGDGLEIRDNAQFESRVWSEGIVFTLKELGVKKETVRWDIQVGVQTTTSRNNGCRWGRNFNWSSTIYKARQRETGHREDGAFDFSAGSEG